VGSNGELKDTPANRALVPAASSIDALLKPELRAAAYYTDELSLLLRMDVRAGLRALIDAGVQVDCIVTSPPYYGQRDYGYAGQIGLEEHPSNYIDALAEVFDLCSKLLKDTGSLWINIGDTYWSGKGAHKSKESKQGARRFGLRPQDKAGDGRWARPKQLLLIPHRMAIALQERGWLVRNDNVWVKPNPVPDQVRDRCSIAHEYVFHLAKSRWYYFDRLRVGRTATSGRVLPPLDTWEVPPSPGNSTHRASFSDELIRIPIMATTPPDGIVLDPFSGVGTTMLFAKRHGLRSIGIELSDEYCRLAASALPDVKGEPPLAELK
jgi:site-specific DNA-methyltransferase (adenine-specific)